jgi:hypothetical protein
VHARVEPSVTSWRVSARADLHCAAMFLLQHLTCAGTDPDEQRLQLEPQPAKPSKPHGSQRPLGNPQGATTEQQGER